MTLVQVGNSPSAFFIGAVSDVPTHAENLSVVGTSKTAPTKVTNGGFSTETSVSVTVVEAFMRVEGAHWSDAARETLPAWEAAITGN